MYDNRGRSNITDLLFNKKPDVDYGGSKWIIKNFLRRNVNDHLDYANSGGSKMWVTVCNLAHGRSHVDHMDLMWMRMEQAEVSVDVEGFIW